ncbi:MAG: pyocin activator PrtN family protein [Pseudomonadota bacterium]|nr:pyocin activator PrtN family protein [Pseudomonadota bacterium]MEE3098179.1 pyocin activator PrtN family protein [Pseudomonadota bacterium]
MKTIMMLFARYEGQPQIPLDRVREDFFGGMTREVFKKKVESGEVPLPLIRLGKGQKAALMIALQDLADYLDRCADEARRELVRKLG